MYAIFLVLYKVIISSSVFMSGIYSFYSGTFESVDQHRYSCVITIFLLDNLPSYRSSFCPISCVVYLLLSRPNCPASRKIQFYSIRVSMLKLFSEGKRSYLNSQKRLIVPNGLFGSVHIHGASRTCKFAQKMFFMIDVLMLQKKIIMIF